MDKIKKIAKRVGMAIGALLVLFIGGMLLNFYVRLPKVRPPQTLTAPSNPEAVERGRYLVNNVAGCVGCHSPVQHIPGEPPEEGKLGAGRDFGAPEGAKVHIRAKNITPDKATGIGDYTDGEIARATREGIGKDGHVMFPQMPYRTYGETLSDGEMLDIIAYLRTLKPVANDPGPTTAGFPVSMFIRGVPQPVETVAPPAPSPSDKMARGKWLLRVCSCNECHDSVDSHMQKIPGKSLAGGFRFTIPDRLRDRAKHHERQGNGHRRIHGRRHRARDQRRQRQGRQKPLCDALVVLQRHDDRRQGRAHRRAS